MRSQCEPTPPHLPQTADRALQVLMSFDREHPERGVTEVARDFGLPHSVAQRLLAVLTHRGFLSRDPGSRRYRIGPAALHLGRLWDRSGSLALLAGPVLSELSEHTGHGSYFSLPDGAYMRCILLAEGADGRLRDYSLIGEMYPAHAGATSKAYFAFLPREDRAQLLRDRPMARYTDATVTDLDKLERQYARIRRQRWAFTIGEYSPGTATVAVPVFLRGALYGSLSLGWMAGEDTQHENHPEQLVAILRERADLIERRLAVPLPRAPLAPRRS
jgi:Transcriptional regulator